MARRRKPARRSKAITTIARQRMDYLCELAQEEARKGDKGDWDLADRAIRLARAIGMRYNLRLTREQKLLMCRNCHGLLWPGRTARVRLRKGIRTVFCANCGEHSRWGYEAPAAEETSVEAP